jgi:PAS domain S-box-containing protein
MKTGDQKELQFIEINEDKRYAKELEQAYAEIKQLKLEKQVIDDRIRAMVENLPDAIFLIDARSGRFIDCNNKGIEMFGWPLEKLRTFTPAELSPPFMETGRQTTEIVRDVMDQLMDGTPKTFEWRHVHADGRDVLCEIRIVLLPSSDPPTFSAICTDITDRKKNEEGLQKALAKIGELSEQLKQENILLRQELKGFHTNEDIVGESEAILSVLKKAKLVAGQDTSVLIMGETGTGKELLARAIHRMSPRMKKPLVTVHCGALLYRSADATGGKVRDCR